MNSIASKEGDVYLMGGLINGESVRGDLWMVEAGTSHLSCYPIATVSEGPGPRVGHASLLVGNAFIVFGGDTQQEDTDVLDDTLYLLNTSKHTSDCCFQVTNAPSFETMVESLSSWSTSCRPLRPYSQHTGLQDIHLRWSG